MKLTDKQIQAITKIAQESGVDVAIVMQAIENRTITMTELFNGILGSKVW